MDEIIKEYFKEKYLKSSCFTSLDELMKDKTNVFVNSPRALIAARLIGIWIGLNDSESPYCEK